MGELYYNGFSRSGMGRTAWVAMAQDKDRCQALVNAVMILLVP